jgi:hypothetical protein
MLIVLLMLISAVVFVMQTQRKNAWWLICLYWLVLTLKNMGDSIAWINLK